jgi:crotonobetainyl-CoA:carnitine CoA-transferase CaiB-like acyl-CoA transferase
VAVIERLAAIADVFVEGFRPGVADRLGVGYERISAIKPDVVYCSISGYGQAGPYRDVPGHDVNYLGVAGGVEVPVEGELPAPQAIGMPIVDLSTGTSAALAVVAALRRRDRDGCGGFLDIAMLDSAVFWSNLKLPAYGRVGEPAYGTFRVADGVLSLGVLEDKFWVSLCKVMDWSDWEADPSLAEHGARQARAAEIVARLAPELATRSLEHWLAMFSAFDVPAAVVYEEGAFASDPQVVERRLHIDGPARLRSPLPPEISATPVRDAPGRGSDALTLLAELGYDEREQEELVASGAVLGEAPASAVTPTTVQEAG